jgi:DNA repair exonuclease SbcCD ATPase subunit
MTEEEIKALQEKNSEYEKKVSDLMASVESIRNESLKAKEDLNKVVEELKEERRKKNEALEKQKNINENPADVESLVSAALSKKEEERRKAELDQAIEEFKASKTEFQADPSGLVYAKFQKVLSQFNFSDVESKEQAKKRLEDVYKFSKFKGEADPAPAYEGTPASGGAAPAPASGDTDKELEKVFESTKITKEKFSELKTKYGEALEGLGIR